MIVCVVTFLLYLEMNRTIRSAALLYAKHGCRRFAGTHAEALLIYMWSSFFFIRSGISFVSASVRDSQNRTFSVKSLCSSAVFGGRLQRPSPCLIRSAPRRERGQTLSKTSEKCAKKCILSGTLQLFFGS